MCTIPMLPQVPACERLTGLTYFRRVMIRLSIAIKAIAGKQGLTATTVIVNIKDVDTERTAEELFENGFFGFSRGNVFLVPAKEESGFTWDQTSHVFSLVRIGSCSSCGTS